LFLDCLLQSMASNDFDHCPLLFELKDNLSVTWRFHFEAFWLKLEGFQDAVSFGWNSVLFVAFATLDAKIKSITKGLQSWSDKNVGHWPRKYSIGWKLLMTSVTYRRGNHGSGTTSRNIVLLSPLSSGRLLYFGLILVG
jgi:hypothetical protein